MKLENDDKKKRTAEDTILDGVTEPEVVEEEVDPENDIPEDDFDDYDDDEEDEDEDKDGVEVGNDTDDDDSDDSEDDEVSEDTDEEPEEDSGVKVGGKLSKEEMKIIAQKKEIKKLQKERDELRKKEQQKVLAKEKEQLKQKFISEDYDEDVAEKMANDELRIRQLEERQALLDFRDENETLFDKYPQAKVNAMKIMQSITATGMTAEQICRGLYGAPKPANDMEQRALDSAIDTEDTTPKKNPIVQQTESLSLSNKQLAYKRRLEREFLNNEKMSNQDFQKFMNRKRSTMTGNERRIN